METSNKQCVAQQKRFLITLPSALGCLQDIMAFNENICRHGTRRQTASDVWNFADFWAFIDCRMTLDAFVGHEGHEYTLEVVGRDAEKLREMFPSSHVPQTSSISFPLEHQAKPIVSALVYTFRSSSHSRWPLGRWTTFPTLFRAYSVCTKSMGCRFSTDGVIDNSRFKGQSTKKSVNNWKSAVSRDSSRQGKQVTFMTSTSCLSCIVCEKDIKILFPCMKHIHRRIPLPKRVSASCRIRFDDLNAAICADLQETTWKIIAGLIFTLPIN